MTHRATSRRVARSSATSALVDQLGDWAAGGPLFRALARSMAGGIERGAFAPGTWLPAERVLATTLAISRGTAAAAYDQLEAEGLVARKQGGGTFVVAADPVGLPEGREGSGLVHRLVDRSAGPSDVVDLSISVICDTSTLPALEVTTDDMGSVVPRTGVTPWGLAPLRAAVAQHVSSWGVATTEGQIVITTGAQQAICIATSCWVRPGETVVVEDPTYPGALSAFAQAGARVVAVPVDHHGVRPDALRDALGSRPSLGYLQPTLHNPTGAVLSASRRRQIAELLSSARVPLVEDMALADLAWQSPPAPIAALAPDASVAVVGSLNKLFWGGLRVGFVRAPEPLALRFARVRTMQDLGTSVVSQVMAERLLFHLRRSPFRQSQQSELRAWFGALAAALRRGIPEWTWPEPKGGLSMWVKLPGPCAESFAHFALRHGVAVATAQALSSTTAHADRLRLSFSAPIVELEEGARRLAVAWRAFGLTSHPAQAERRLPVIAVGQAEFPAPGPRRRTTRSTSAPQEQTGAEPVQCCRLPGSAVPRRRSWPSWPRCRRRRSNAADCHARFPPDRARCRFQPRWPPLGPTLPPAARCTHTRAPTPCRRFRRAPNRC